MRSNIAGKTVLVTGAGQGIGNALCKKLFAMDVKVIAVSRTLEHLEILKRECPSIYTIQVDLSDWARTKCALSLVPTLDGLVNNAGIAIIKPFTELAEQDFDNTFNINMKAVFCVTQAVSEKLKEGSSIVNVSSLASTRSFAGHSIYGATKSGVDSLTRALALEFGPRKIRVNSVNPTVTLTKMGRDNWSNPKKSKPLVDRIPLHRFAEVNEVIDSIIFLLSNESSFVNGHHLLLEGGYSVA